MVHLLLADGVAGADTPSPHVPADLPARVGFVVPKAVGNSVTRNRVVRRLRARTSTTNHPPAPVMAMLGEIVVHGEDIRRPLGLKHQPPEEALVAVADSWKNSNLLIGSKRRITGLRLRATDTEWVHGDGPEVSGPLLSLILAMTGRKDVHPDLTGEGVAELGRRP